MRFRTRKEIEENAKRRRDRKKRSGKNKAEGELKITALLSIYNIVIHKWQCYAGNIWPSGNEH